MDEYPIVRVSWGGANMGRRGQICGYRGNGSESGEKRRERDDEKGKKGGHIYNYEIKIGRERANGSIYIFTLDTRNRDEETTAPRVCAVP